MRSFKETYGGARETMRISGPARPAQQTAQPRSKQRLVMLGQEMRRVGQF